MLVSSWKGWIVREVHRRLPRHLFDLYSGSSWCYDHCLGCLLLHQMWGSHLRGWGLMVHWRGPGQGLRLRGWGLMVNWRGPGQGLRLRGCRLLVIRWLLLAVWWSWWQHSCVCRRLLHLLVGRNSLWW